MNVQLTQIDLGKFGNLSTYEFSGERGEIVHEFAPLTESSNSVAIIVAEGASLRDALTLERGPEHTPVPVARDKSGSYQGSPASVVAIPLDQNGMLARFRYFGNQGVALHIAVIKGSRRAIRRLLHATHNKILRPAILRFKDRCWVCKRIVRFLCSLLISGGIDVDADDVVEILRGIFPDEWLEHLEDTDLGDMLKRILDLLRRHDPRTVVAQKVCEQLGYCRPDPDSLHRAAPSQGHADLERALQYLKSQGVQDPDLDLFIATLSGDSSALSEAIARGANVKITDAQLLERHKALLRRMPRP